MFHLGFCLGKKKLAMCVCQSFFIIILDIMTIVSSSPNSSLQRKMIFQFPLMSWIQSRNLEWCWKGCLLYPLLTCCFPLGTGYLLCCLLSVLSGCQSSWIPRKQEPGKMLKRIIKMSPAHRGTYSLLYQLSHSLKTSTRTVAQQIK